MHKIPVIKIDLTLPAAKRWHHVPIKLKKAACTLANRAADEISDPRVRALAEALIDAATAGRNPYRDDMAAWSDLTGLKRRRVLFSNMTYELSQTAMRGDDVYAKYSPAVKAWWKNLKDRLETIKTHTHGCTAGAAWYPKLGMTHVRTLDWSLDGLGRHTVIWHFIGAAAGEYYSVGWPGYAGVLSGMAPGRFSATINQASPFSMPSLQWPPSHLLRYVCEHAADYNDALAILEATPVCFPAFVMLVGTEPGEAAVIELTPKENRIHPMHGKQPIAIANDYLTGEWRAKFGEADCSIAAHIKGPASEDRRNRMLSELKRRKPADIENALNIVQSTDWIDNESTVQIMAFLPATGQCLVIGQEDEEPVVIGGV